MGCVMTADEALSKFERLAKKLARKYKRRGFELEDLEQEARIATLKALATYDTEKGPLAAHVSVTIGRELATLTGTGEHRRALDPVIDSTSMDATVAGGEDEVTLHDLLGVDPTQESELGDAETNAVIQAAIAKMPASDARLLRLWSSGMTHAQIAEKDNAGRQTISDRCADAIARLARLLRHRVETRRAARAAAAGEAA
jgi:RNA polymerase sigma factor (sigma-70 family)